MSVKLSKLNLILFWGFLFTIFLFLKQSASASQAECIGVISDHCKLHLPGLSNSPASASPIAGITSAHYHTQLIFVFLEEMGFHHSGQAGLKLLISGDLPTSASQSAVITDVGHHAQLWGRTLTLFLLKLVLISFSFHGWVLLMAIITGILTVITVMITGILMVIFC